VCKSAIDDAILLLVARFFVEAYSQAKDSDRIMAF